MSKGSYSQILRSSSIIGGAQGITVLIGLVRIKLVAVLIGPSGVGLLGIYQSVTNLTAIIAGMGIQTSGVRDVARCYGQGDEIGVAKTIATLRRVCWMTGIAGMLILAALAPWISEMSFGSGDHRWAIAGLGITILFGNIAAGQAAIIRGTRRIGDIARINVWGSLSGTVVAAGLYAWFGTAGIVPALVLMSAISLTISTIYARRIKMIVVATTWRESWTQSGSLISFGIAMVFSGIVAAIVTYLTRILITREFGLVGVGIFSAAFNLSGIFVQFILTAMGSDFYPRLTGVSDNHELMSETINQQTEIGLLLAFPGLLATLVFAPYALTLFYTPEFATAGGMLKWFILGCMSRVLSWPLGFSILAKGQGRLYMTTETTYHLVHLGLIWIGLRVFGLEGVAMAFAFLNAVLVFVMLLIARKSIGFRWSRSVQQQISWMCPLATIAVIVVFFASQTTSLVAGILATIASGILCLRQLVVRISANHRISLLLKSLPGGSILLRGL